MAQWYRELFANYARAYDTEHFTQGTGGEVDFIVHELGHDNARRVLDIGCGTGRHAIELARRGYRVTGIDLSPAQLARAREKAAAAGVEVELLERDATEPHFEAEFDAAICVCEGGFCLMESDEKNARILANAARALRPGGVFILTALNALFPLVHYLKAFYDRESTTVDTRSLRFDPLTFRAHESFVFTDDGGTRKTVESDERFYAPSEIRWLLRSCGFADVAIHGCHLGAWSREHALSADDHEILVVARLA